jgi:preprotein translocase subunit SecD
VQDTAKAKDIIGRTATLEARLADPINTHPNPNDPVPPGEELFTQGNQAPVLLKKDVIFTGDRIIDASAGFDEHQRPSVNIRLDAAGGRSVRAVSRENIGKPMAMVLFEKGKGEVLTVATIQSELGDRFQITGQPTPRPRPTSRCCCAPARSPHRWTSSKNARSARASARTTSRRASTR